MVDRVKGQPSTSLINFTENLRKGEGHEQPFGSTDLVSIADSLDPLKKYFNENIKKIRFLALLSPT